MAPVRSYTNWNSRTTDEEEQIEPYRKYFFICEGANTETWYFKKLIDIRKELNIHPLIDIRLLEKTEGDRDILKCTLCQGHYDFSFSDFYFIFICCVEASK